MRPALGAATIGRMDTINMKELALRSIRIMGDGTLDDFHEVIHPEFLNHEDKDEPPETRGRGPEPAYKTALWLRDAFAELRWEIHEVVCEGDLVVVHCTMSGRHVRPFAEYAPDGQVRDVFPPTGKRFAATQTHWLRIADGHVIEHWANRDDIGMAMQLGWVPPSPLYLLRSAVAKRRARRVDRPGRLAASRAAALLAVCLAALGVHGTQWADAGIALNTIDERVTLSQEGTLARATGPIACTRGETIAIRVRVTQPATGAAAREAWRARCTGEVQHWQVRARAIGEARFAPGRAEVCAVAKTRAGRELTGKRRWCRRVAAA